MAKEKTCEEMGRLMVLAVNGEADRQQGRILERHIEECIECGNEFRELRALRAVMPGMKEADISWEKVEGIKESVSRSLEKRRALPLRRTALKPALALCLAIAVVLSVFVFKTDEFLEDDLYSYDPEYFEIDGELVEAENDFEALWLEVYAGIDGFF